MTHLDVFFLIVIGILMLMLALLLTLLEIAIPFDDYDDEIDQKRGDSNGTEKTSS